MAGLRFVLEFVEKKLFTDSPTAQHFRAYSSFSYIILRNAGWFLIVKQLSERYFLKTTPISHHYKSRGYIGDIKHLLTM